MSTDRGAELADAHKHPVLVVGVDGSSASWDAFSWLAGEAQRSNGLMIAVLVVPLADPATAMCAFFPLAAGAAKVAKEEAADYLAQETARRAGEIGVEVKFVLEHGDAAQALARVARCAHADLIAVGRSAKRRHRLAGSLGRRLALDGDLPAVVVVP
jgi:nucleotide-binding universal stress UspA family protein